MLIDRDKMQIVIEIPSAAYKACLKMKSDDDDGLLGFCLINAVANGKTTEHPSAERVGKWEIYAISMLDGEGCKCSECGFEGAPYWDYCPNCGARMVSE